MKGWLDNYNDSKISIPEGFQGEGYSTKGRNYSPAWGGQFQNGGKAPLYVESKNDPRYKAYQDSLSLYNESINDLNLLKKMKSSGKAIDFLESRFESGEPRKNNKYPLSQKGKESFNSLKKLNKKEPKPSYKKIEYDGLFGLGSSISIPIYKKPQQQVIVKDKTNTSSGYRSESQYKKEHPPIYLKDSNDPRIGTYHEKGNQYLYKKPKPTLQPKVKALNLQPIQTPVEENFDFPTAELPSINFGKIPKSYDVSMQRYNMEGPNDYYKANEEGVDYERAMEIKAASDAYNKYIQEKYGNEDALKNPKAVERLKQLRQNVEVVPQYQMGGSVYPVNYVPQAQMGGSIPGAVGFSYARTQSPAPSNGPYAKKTKASAKDGKVIEDDLGQWAHPGEITEINSPYITMKGVPYPVLGISNEGDVQMMYPEEEYEFIGDKVTEFPMAKNGLRQEQKGLVNLDNLVNFTNYNKPTVGGWLDKYSK